MKACYFFATLKTCTLCSQCLYTEYMNKGGTETLTIKGAVPLETAALNRRRRSYAMYLFLVVCSMYAYFVVAVETDTNRQLL